MAIRRTAAIHTTEIAIEDASITMPARSRLAALDGRLLLAAGGAGSHLWWAAAGG